MVIHNIPIPEKDMTTHTVKVVNNANTAWKFYVYQSPPADNSDLTLAWFTSPFKIPSGGGTTEFSWQDNHQFVWSSTGIVAPGITFKASGIKECDLQDANTTTFTFQDDTPDLSDPVFGGDAGTLYINAGGEIPANTFAVGVGMSGSGTFVANTGPNLRHIFTPKPAYYIAAINEVEQGEVMDIKTITQTAEIKFPINVFKMTATLQENNAWSITQSPLGLDAKVPQVDQVAKGTKDAQVR